jgi:ssRNA-specific RNase YbeY (16S rRNA maturation enzyme)
MKAKRANSNRNIILNLFLSAILSVISFAGANAQKTQSAATSPVNTLTYVGTADEHVNFLLNYDNEANEKFVVIVSNASGKTLYEEVYAERKLTKIFSVPVDFGNVTFTVAAYRNKSDKKFQVSTERKVVEEVIIKKP